MGELEKIFQRHDANNSGGIDRKELRMALQEAGIYTKSNKDLDRVLETFDTDKSGRIEFNEFVKLAGTYEVLKDMEKTFTTPVSDTKPQDPKLMEIFNHYDRDNS